MITREMIEQAAQKLKQASGIKMDYILCIHPDRAGEAYELGLAPFCVLGDYELIEAEVK